MSLPRASGSAASAGAPVVAATSSHEAVRQAVLAYGTALAAGVLLPCAFAPLNLLAARDPVPGAADVAVGRQHTAPRGLERILVRRRHLRVRHLVAVHQHPRRRRAPILAGARAGAGAGWRSWRLYHALLGFLSAWALPATGPWRWLVGLPALWLLIEWWRGWFVSGFPWLSLGYSQTDTWLAGLAPLTGVYGLSALLLLGSGALLALLRGKSPGAPGRCRAAGTAVAAGRGAAARRLDAACRASSQRRDPAGSGAAGPEMAGGQCRADAGAVHAAQ